MKDYYAILGVAPDCAPEDIKAAYRALVLIHHPDQNPDQTTAAHERFLEIKEAYDLLSNPLERADYDVEYVAAFPGYELEGEEEDDWEDYEPNPPARMPVSRGDGTNGQLKIFMVLLLPILSGAVTMIVSGEVWPTAIAALGGLALAIWIGKLLGPDED
jgi:hypothetical protein